MLVLKRKRPGVDPAGLFSNHSFSNYLDLTHPICFEYAKRTIANSDDDQLIADIQGWVDGSLQNLGWRVQVSEEDTLNNARAMDPGSVTIHWTAPEFEYRDGFEDPPPP